MNDKVPYCPPGWTCDFIPPEGPTLPWWQTDGGAACFIIVAVALCAVMAYAISQFVTWRRGRTSAKDACRERELERRHRLAVEEQKTMQMDIARGNPEVLKLLRQVVKERVQ